MKRFFGLVELVGFEWYQRFTGPVAFVLFTRFVEFMKFEGFLWGCGVGGGGRVSEVHGACGVRDVRRVCGVHEV